MLLSGLSPFRPVNVVTGSADLILAIGSFLLKKFTRQSTGRLVERAGQAEDAQPGNGPS